MIKRTFRWITYALALVLLLILIAAAIVRFAIFPNVNHYKNEIAETISQQIGLKTTVGHIETGWSGISPKVAISTIDIVDSDNKPALHLENVKATLSWLSIPMLHPHLSSIDISNPQLTIHRKENGNIYVAGIPMAGEGEPDFANWVLSQANINIHNASILWQDDLRQAPPLSLNKVYLTLSNPAWRKIIGQHLFHVSALPSIGTKDAIALDGHFFGRDVSKMNTWYGKANLKTEDIDLTAWKAWLDYPIDLQSGSGNTDVSLTFSHNKISKIKADVTIRDLAVKLNANSQLFNAALLSGLLTWENSQETTTVSGQNITLKADNGLDVNNGSGLFSHTIKDKKSWVNVSLKLDSFDLHFLNALQNFIALPKSISQPLNALSPTGKLNQLVVSLEGNPQNPAHYQIKTDFESLSINAYNQIPGFKNISGDIDADENNGVLQLTSTNAELDLKSILRWPIPVQSLDGRVRWYKSNDRLKITADNVSIANEHINGSLDASYHMSGIKGGYLDLSANFDNGDAQFAPFYYPTVMGKDTISWLDDSIISGKASNVAVIVKGHLDDFPFVDKQEKPDPSLGAFKVSARIDDAVLEYGNGWPKLEGVGLNMLFEGNSMVLEADAGKTFGLNVINAKAVIPQLNTYGANAQILSIKGQVNGPIAESIKFINKSPVKEVTLGFTDDLKTAGHGKLNLSLSLPLNDIEKSTYEGKYTMIKGVIANKEIGLPDITNINGQLNFDGSGIHAKEIDGELLGGPMQLNLKTAADSTISIDAKGSATGYGIQQFTSNPLTEAMSGSAEWSANIAIKKPLMNFNIASTLEGLAIDLPAPLGKQNHETASFSAIKKQTTTTADRFDITYNDVVSAIILRHEENGHLTIDRGDIAINTPVEMPTKTGLALRGQFDYINADNWLALNSTPKTKDNPSSLQLDSVDFSIQKLDIFNRSLHTLNITSQPSDDLRVSLTSQEIDGDIEWSSPTKSEENGKIIARLKKLHIPASNAEQSAATEEDIKKLDKQYPALDIKADDFKLGVKAFGNLELNAYEVNDDWVIDKLAISNPDSTLLASGRWHNWTRNPNTNLTFTLSSSDVGHTLGRFGQPEAIKGGVAQIAGQLQWPGSPHEFKKNGLNGDFRLGAAKGQVLKVKPGVGRLLGLLTLQSLPRRLTLDFRDIFSEGFAFDEISGTAKINNGVMHSDDFFMTGPAADTKIKGDINLVAETQSLKVKVTPHISDTLSLAALAGGPIAGAAAFVAQKILKDPLNKIAQSEYTITGTWDNPEEAGVKKENGQIPTSSPLTAQ